MLATLITATVSTKAAVEAICPRQPANGASTTGVVSGTAARGKKRRTALQPQMARVSASLRNTMYEAMTTRGKIISPSVKAVMIWKIVPTASTHHRIRGTQTVKMNVISQTKVMKLEMLTTSGYCNR